MHIFKEIEQPSGAVASCWKISDVQSFTASNVVKLSVDGWKDENARIAGKTPLTRTPREYDIDNTGFLPDPIFFDAGTSYLAVISFMSDALLSYLLTLPDFAGGEIRE